MHNCGTYEVSLSELKRLPVLHQGQADDCLIESDTERVWLSRCTVEDGQPWDNLVTVERRIAGAWIEVEYWEARDDAPFFDHFELELELGNDGMRSGPDVAAALRAVADRIESELEARGTIRDVNGNTVGSYGPA